MSWFNLKATRRDLELLEQWRKDAERKRDIPLIDEYKSVHIVDDRLYALIPKIIGQKDNDIEISTFLRISKNLKNSKKPHLIDKLGKDSKKKELEKKKNKKRKHHGQS